MKTVVANPFLSILERKALMEKKDGIASHGGFE